MLQYALDALFTIAGLAAIASIAWSIDRALTVYPQLRAELDKIAQENDHD